VDNPCYEPLGPSIDPLGRVDSAIEDTVVADPQPMPRRSSSEGLDVEVGVPSRQGGKRLANPSEPLPRADAPGVALSSPGQDDAAHASGAQTA